MPSGDGGGWAPGPKPGGQLLAYASHWKYPFSPGIRVVMPLQDGLCPTNLPHTLHRNPPGFSGDKTLMYYRRRLAVRIDDLQLPTEYPVPDLSPTLAGLLRPAPATCPQHLPT